jgi:hypothetical protein
MRRATAIFPALLAALLWSAPARAQQVDLLLALRVDASGSIDPEEFRLQREGYATALADPRTLAAIRAGQAGAIAVAFIEWGTPGAPITVLNWTIVKDQATAKAFGERLLAEPRRPQSYNAIGDAIVHATTMIHAAPLKSGRAVIDVSGDGPDLRSLIPAEAARDKAVKDGITINALAIYNPGSSTAMGREPLDAYYERAVIGGPGAFVIVAQDYKHFAESILTKLVKEIAAAPAPATTRTAEAYPAAEQEKP